MLRRSRAMSRVVVIDQMEELFTSCRDAAERERYVDALLDAPSSCDGRVLVACACAPTSTGTARRSRPRGRGLGVPRCCSGRWTTGS